MFNHFQDQHIVSKFLELNAMASTFFHFFCPHINAKLEIILQGTSCLQSVIQVVSNWSDTYIIMILPSLQRHIRYILIKWPSYQVAVIKHILCQTKPGLSTSPTAQPWLGTRSKNHWLRLKNISPKLLSIMSSGLTNIKSFLWV